MCKYCSKLGTGDCNDFIFDVNYPISIGGVEFGRLCIDTLIIENDLNRDDYDIEMDGIILQTTVGTEDGRHAIRSTKRIKFCPFCGASLKDVFKNQCWIYQNTNGKNEGET